MVDLAISAFLASAVPATSVYRRLVTNERTKEAAPLCCTLSRARRRSHPARDCGWFHHCPSPTLLSVAPLACTLIEEVVFQLVIVIQHALHSQWTPFSSLG
jgi:hypothetical protein